ncbi:MAG: hypothetical protein V1873_02190 [Verrucomicrobiota bacterium]
MKFHAPVSSDTALRLPLVFAHFPPWYTLRGGDYPLPPEEQAALGYVPPVGDNRHWNDPRSGYRRTHHHVPAIGRYDSRDPRTIEWQIETALQFGVSGFIINWYGKHSVENVITLHWLRGLRRWNRAHPDRPFHYFLSVDWQIQAPTEDKRVVPVDEDFAYIRDHLVTEAYLRRDGRPVFSVFSVAKDAPRWRQALDAAFGPQGADLIWIDSAPGAGENACYAWVQPDPETVNLSSPYCWSDPDSAGEHFLRRFYEQANRKGFGAEYVMHGVWPGFNNQFVSWAWSQDPTHPNIRPCVICRETTRGNTLDLTWQVYLDYLARWAKGDPGAQVPAPLVQLVTWNDYAETTTVEPTRDYGTAPLELCKARLEKAREIWQKTAGKVAR